MRKSRFFIFLTVIFILSFCWAGGYTIINLLPVPAVFSEGQTGTAPNTNTKDLSLWNRCYRIIALKQVVNVRLSRTKCVRIQEIPPSMQQAIIAIEDNRFYSHHGIDTESVMRAVLVNMQYGQYLQGGSTITQQLVKNLLLSQDRTAERKLEEAVLALDMEMHYSKEEILEMYLNTIYFGSGAYGIGEASRIYFGKQPSELNLSECAMLAGLPNAPSLLSPYVNLDAAKQRQALVLTAMVKYNFIDQATAEEAKNAPIKLAK